jgi:class 3 adenylate cyclase
MVNFASVRICERSWRAERRQVTVMSCELISEMAGSETSNCETGADPDDVACQVERYRADVAESVSRYGGLIIGDIGGSVVAVWGSSAAGRRFPGARTQYDASSPRTAILAALDLGERRYPAARVKIAVDAGIVIVNYNADHGVMGDLVGQVLGAASTLRAHSENQTVVVSDAARHLAADAFVFVPIELPEIDPITSAPAWSPARQFMWRVTACKPRWQQPDRRMPRLVGNRRQTAALEQALVAVLARSRQVVVLTGEPGIGKSALFRHFRVRVQVSTARWIEATCRPEQSYATLQPIRDLLRQALPKPAMDHR